MAGSYNHVIDNKGDLLNNDRMMISGAMIENLGDAYEAIEEMYGMIWWLANLVEGSTPPEIHVEKARQNYTVGLKLAQQNTNKLGPGFSESGG